MHIAVDMDDVILDFCGGLRQAVMTEFNVELKDEDFYQFDLHPILDPIIGRSWWSWLRERDWLWANFPAINGALGGLESLRRDGHYLEIVTSKPEWAEASVYKWLGKWRPPVQRVTIVGLEDKKVDHTDAALLIDDKVQNLTEWIAGPARGDSPYTTVDGISARGALLFDRPHNQQKAPFLRAMDWAEVVAFVRVL